MILLRRLLKRTTVLVAAALSVPFVGTAPAQGAGDQAYECFPTCSATDARMLSLAGFTYSSIAGFHTDVRITVPASAAQFEIGVFDGDTGKDPAGVLNPAAGHWDEGTHELEYTLYADPRGDGSATELVAVWGGNRVNPLQGPGWSASSAEMPDNDWWTVLLSTAENARTRSRDPYVYLLRIANHDADISVSSAFKLRTTGRLEVGSDGQPWGIHAAVTAAGKPDARVVYPEWDGNFELPSPDFFLTTPTTYDGNWEFSFDIGRGRHEILIFDGDMDFGSVGLPAAPSGQTVQWCADAADPDSIGLPDFALGTFAYPDRISPAGHPADDNRLDFFRRPPCVQYALRSPSGSLYRNINPSGEQEWERFMVTSRSSATRQEADYAPTVASDGSTYVPKGGLEVGEWKLLVSGLDLGNTAFFSGPSVKGFPSASLAGRVWSDLDGDGTAQPGEPGLQGVAVLLYEDNGDGVLVPNPTPGSPESGRDRWVARQSTGPDGKYLLRGLGAGRFFVVLDEATLPYGAGFAAAGTCRWSDPCPLRESESLQGPSFGIVAGP